MGIRGSNRGVHLPSIDKSMEDKRMILGVERHRDLENRIEIDGA